MIGLFKRYSFSIAFVGALAFFFFVVNSEDDDILQLSGYTMGTTFRLQFIGIPDNAGVNQIEDDVARLLERLDREIFSTYAEQSELSTFNRAPIGQPVKVSGELLEVVLLAREVSEFTGGAFDVTVGPLVNLWGFGPQMTQDQVPSDEQISLARQKVGFEHLRIDQEQSTLTREADIYVDLSGIAKGYVVDQVAAYFDSIELDSYFLEVGGEIKIKGVKPDGEFWIPAVERPVDTAPQVYEILNSRGEELAIAGSGDYRNYFETEGVRYSHEIDPRSGQPISHNLAAVYVIDKETARADALATSLMVLGYEAGMELARTAGLAVYFIVRENDDFTSYFSEQFARYIQNREVAP